MTPAEYVAHRTWNTLGRVTSLRARFGEETLTDLLMLDMLRSHRATAFRLLSTTRPAEARCGADMLVVVRGPFGWSSYAVQAKKLHSNGTYSALNSGHKSREQLHTLNRFARDLRAFPLYLFYNHCASAGATHWHCTQSFVASQLGCTVVPSWRIRDLIGANTRRVRKSFDLLNKSGDSLPWRCLFDCSMICKPATRFLRGSPFRSPERRATTDATIHDPDWPSADSPRPPWLFDVPNTQFTLRDFDRLRAQVSSSDQGSARLDDELADKDALYPARLLVIDHGG